ncbi:MAG: hypothetical protein WD451_10625 [Thermoanaerobaculia bacterium]
MITGFNTDVKHRNRVFHIQTEDKGEANPFVESLVYVGGEILATKRTSYADVLKDDHAVQDLMEQQHRTMIAAIQRGRFDGPNGGIQIPEGMTGTAPPAPPAKAGKAEVAEKVEKKEDAPPPPGTPSPLGTSSRSLDQMVLDYLGSEEVPDEVELTLTPTPDFTSGRSVQTKLKATSGAPARALAGASVQVRILSTSARVTTVFQGKTAADGSCMVSFMLPSFPNGSAAAVIRVTGGNASSEIQYSIKKK